MQKGGKKIKRWRKVQKCRPVRCAPSTVWLPIPAVQSAVRIMIAPCCPKSGFGRCSGLRLEVIWGCSSRSPTRLRSSCPPIRDYRRLKS